MSRPLAAMFVAVGLLCIGIALGLIYMDFKEREGAWAHLDALARSGDPEARAYLANGEDQLLGAWEPDGFDWAALIAGSVGAALAGAGAVLLVLELKWFRRPAPDT